MGDMSDQFGGDGDCIDEREPAQMTRAGFVWDPTPSGLPRWTEFETMISCVRQPYMNDSQWDAERAAALARSTASADASRKSEGT